MAFTKAVRYGINLRMALAGPSGAGKTFTALTLATALAGDKRVAVIDTERGSARRYAKTKDGRGFDFDVVELTSYNPQNFIDAIHEAEQGGYGVLVIDSLTHAWNSVGGVLEIVDKATNSSTNKNKFTSGWSKGTPLHNKLIDTIFWSPLHIIVTMRSKMEYVLGPGTDGKSTPRKVGLGPVQRGDIEYEFDIYGEMTIENTLCIQKWRNSEYNGAEFEKPGAEVASFIAAWLDGEPAPERVPALNDIYKIGVQSGAWTGKTFLACASHILDVPITINAILNRDMARLLLEAAEAGPVEVEEEMAAS